MSEQKKRNIERLQNLSKNCSHQLEIEPMEKCLHGLRCGFLNAPGKVSPTCGLSRDLLFDMKECPNGDWRIGPPWYGEQTIPWEPPTVTAKRIRASKSNDNN